MNCRALFLQKSRAFQLLFRFLAAHLILAAIPLLGCATSQSSGDFNRELVELANGSKSFRQSNVDMSGPMPVLVLRGNSYEQGLAYGVLMKERLLEAYRDIELLFESMTAPLPWYKRWVFKRVIARRLREFEERTPKNYRDEMRGLATGSGVDYEQVVFAAAGMGIIPMCTSVLSSDSNTGGLLHGRNFDVDAYFFGNYPVIVRHELEEGISHWSISVIGYLPSFNGFNDAGISVSVNASYPNGSEPDGLPIGWKMREILGKSESLDDVRRVVTATKNDNLNMMLIAGSASERTGIVFDLKDNVQAEEQMEDSKPMVVLNRTFGDERHKDDGLAVQHMHVIESSWQHNVDRWEAAKSYVDTNGIGNEEDMWGLLRDKTASVPGFFFSTGTIANASTLFSIVFNLGKERISLSTASSWAPMRQVWSFDIPTRKFSPFLSPDPFVETIEFQQLQRKYLQIEGAMMSGEFTREMLTPDLDPLMIIEYGNEFFDPKHPDPQFADVLKKAAMEHTETWEFYFWYGIIFKDSDPPKAIDAFNQALSAPNLNLFRKLLIFEVLVDLHVALNENKSAAGYASNWLESANALCEGYTTPRYVIDNKKRMAELASQ